MRATGSCAAMDGRQLISSGSPYELTVGYSRAVRVGDRVVVAGTAPQWPDGTVDPDPAAQARRCFEIIGQALEDAGAVVRRRGAQPRVPRRRRRLRADLRGPRRGVQRRAARPTPPSSWPRCSTRSGRSRSRSKRSSPPTRRRGRPSCPGPLDLLEALARQEVAITPTLRHVEVFTMRGLLTILWHGDPDAEAVVVVCGGAMGGLLGPADGFYQWLGDELATRGSGIGVLRVGWRRPNDIDLCTLDLLAAADLAAQDRRRALRHRRAQLRRRHRGAGRHGHGRLDPRGGHLRHPVGRLRGGAAASPLRCSRTTATATRSSRRSRARWWASWSAARPTSGLCRVPATCSPRRASGCAPRSRPGSASGSRRYGLT